MKLRHPKIACKQRLVAPHAGAWIETQQENDDMAGDKVAPHAGAWIETAHRPRKADWGFAVAPHAGAWIETCRASQPIPPSDSRPPCGGVD